MLANKTYNFKYVFMRLKRDEIPGQYEAEKSFALHNYVPLNLYDVN